MGLSEIDRILMMRTEETMRDFNLAEFKRGGAADTRRGRFPCAFVHSRTGVPCSAMVRKAGGFCKTHKYAEKRIAARAVESMAAAQAK